MLTIFISPVTTDQAQHYEHVIKGLSKLFVFSNDMRISSGYGYLINH